MYEYVANSESRKFRQVCSDILTKTRDNLRNNYDIISQFTLVGSGARNLITRDGNGRFDLDYNLEIIKAPAAVLKDPKKLKETVRKCLNSVVRTTNFSDSKDSTSVLTCIYHSGNNLAAMFKFDVAIVKKNDSGTLMKNVHNKTEYIFGSAGQYTWNEINDSHDVSEKVCFIKNKSQWNQVRERYLELKNMYLKNRDYNHPSFIVYVEAVNEIYYKIKGGTRK